MNQAEAQYREILHTLDKLLTNLGLMLEDYDVEYLTQADLYIEIYKVMFPVLEPALNVNFGEDISDQEIIQYLINLLAKDIIKMDLDHIKGELIAQGDAKSILNFLQLLFEISNMVVDRDDDKKKGKKSRKSKHQKLVKSSANSVDHASNHSQKSSEAEWKQKYNSVLGINAEFSNSSVTGESAYDPNQEEEEEGHHEVEAAAHRNAGSEVKRQTNKSADEHHRGYDSQSASRVSEAHQSGGKQKYEEYSHQRSSGAKDSQKHASRNSEHIRENEQEHYHEEEAEGESYQGQEAVHEDEEEEEEYQYGQNQGQYAHQYPHEQLEGHTGEEEYSEQDHKGYDQQGREDIRAIDRKAENMMNRDESSHQHEEEYEEGEGEEYVQDSQQGEEYAEEEYEHPEEMDPRAAMGHMEDVEEVIEEHDEGNEESKTYDQENQPGYYNQAQYVSNEAQGRVKGSAKARPQTAGAKKKKSSKLQGNKIEYRQLNPPTAGMKKTKQNKSLPGGKKSQKGSSTKKHKLVHSKSERNLNMEDEEQRPSQSITEEVSEEMAMEPKEYPSNEEVEGQSQREEQEEGQEQFLEDPLQNVPDGNIFKILSDNVMRVKENLRENREIQDIAFDDDKTVKIITQQKNQYKQYLNDFMKDHQMREKKFVQMRGLAEKNFMKKMKSEKIRDDMLKKEFENQQKSLYYKMRDEKVNYLRKVHKTIFELEKKRIIEDKKEYMDFRKTKNSETRNMIDSIKSEYRNKLDMLREKNKNEENERKVANEAQRSFLQALEKELRTEQMKEVNRVKDKWRHEKEKFEMMMKDEGFLQQRVMQLYKKGTF